MFPLVTSLSRSFVKIFSCLFFHAGSYVIYHTQMCKWLLSHTCDSKSSGFKWQPLLVGSTLLQSPYPFAASDLPHILYKLQMMWEGCRNIWLIFFCQAPFIFSRRVILHLQREQKDSYYCVLSYVTFISSALYFLTNTFVGS